MPATRTSERIRAAAKEVANSVVHAASSGIDAIKQLRRSERLKAEPKGSLGSAQPRGRASKAKSTRATADGPSKAKSATRKVPLRERLVKLPTRRSARLLALHGGPLDEAAIDAVTTAVDQGSFVAAPPVLAGQNTVIAAAELDNVENSQSASEAHDTFTGIFQDIITNEDHTAHTDTETPAADNLAAAPAPAEAADNGSGEVVSHAGADQTNVHTLTAESLIDNQSINEVEDDVTMDDTPADANQTTTTDEENIDLTNVHPLTAANLALLGGPENGVKPSGTAPSDCPDPEVATDVGGDAAEPAPTEAATEASPDNVNDAPVVFGPPLPPFWEKDKGTGSRICVMWAKKHGYPTVKEHWYRMDRTTKVSVTVLCPDTIVQRLKQLEGGVAQVERSEIRWHSKDTKKGSELKLLSSILPGLDPLTNAPVNTAARRRRCSPLAGPSLTAEDLRQVQGDMKALQGDATVQGQVAPGPSSKPTRKPAPLARSGTLANVDSTAPTQAPAPAVRRPAPLGRSGTLANVNTSTGSSRTKSSSNAPSKSKARKPKKKTPGPKITPIARRLPVKPDGWKEYMKFVMNARFAQRKWLHERRQASNHAAREVWLHHRAAQDEWFLPVYYTLADAARVGTVWMYSRAQRFPAALEALNALGTSKEAGMVVVVLTAAGPPACATAPGPSTVDAPAEGTSLKRAREDEDEEHLHVATDGEENDDEGHPSKKAKMTSDED